VVIMLQLASSSGACLAVILDSTREYRDREEDCLAVVLDSTRED
jgi:hypothetical protein